MLRILRLPCSRLNLNLKRKKKITKKHLKVCFKEETLRYFCIKKTPGYAWGSKKLIAMSINKKPPLKNKI
ncbi:MAG: hypothetical protein E6590_11880, partial [Clostridiales bacterium]|nr:hypothetical protein [Clostridiales bacterium]